MRKIRIMRRINQTTTCVHFLCQDDESWPLISDKENSSFPFSWDNAGLKLHRPKLRAAKYKEDRTDEMPFSPSRYKGRMIDSSMLPLNKGLKSIVDLCSLFSRTSSQKTQALFDSVQKSCQVEKSLLYLTDVTRLALRPC